MLLEELVVSGAFDICSAFEIEVQSLFLDDILVKMAPGILSGNRVCTVSAFLSHDQTTQKPPADNAKTYCLDLVRINGIKDLLFFFFFFFFFFFSFSSIQ